MDTTLIPPFDEWRDLLPRGCLLSEAVRRAVGEERATRARQEVIEAARMYTSELKQLAQRAGYTLPGQTGDSGAVNPTIVMAGHQPVIYHSGLLEKTDRLAAFSQSSGAIVINVAIDTDEGDGGRILWPAARGDDVALRAETIGTSAALFKDQRVRKAEEVARIFEEIRRDLKESGRGDLLPSVDTVARVYEVLSGESIVAVNAIARMIMTEGGYLELPLSRLIELPTIRQFVEGLFLDSERFVSTYNATLEEYRRAHNIKNLANPFPNMAIDASQIEMPFWYLRQGSRTPVRLPRDQARSHEESRDVAPRGSVVTLLLRGLCSDMFIHGLGGSKYDHFVDALALAYWGVPLPRFVVASATRYLFPEQVDRYTHARGVRERYKEMVSHTESFLGQGIFTRGEEELLRPLLEKRKGLLTEMRGATVGEERSRIAHALNGVNRELKSFIDGSSLAPTITDGAIDDARFSRWACREFPYFMFPKAVEAV